MEMRILFYKNNTVIMFDSKNMANKDCYVRCNKPIKDVGKFIADNYKDTSLIATKYFDTYEDADKFFDKSYMELAIHKD